MEEERRPAVLELVDRTRPEGDTLLYACGVCGQIYSLRIYACSGKPAHKAARRAAEECGRCRAERPDPEKDRREAAERRLARIAKATVVTDLEYCFSDDGDGFYSDVDEAADAGETGVFGAKFKPFQIDVNSVLEGVLENHHEDADIRQLNGVDELVAALDAFNSKQTMGSYEMDEKTWQAVRQTQTFAMIKPDATARGVEEQMMRDIEAAGFRIKERKRLVMSRDDAEWLYREHGERSHFKDLVDYTISGEVVMMLIEGDGDNVPADFRSLMGPTDRLKAEPHTLRAKYAVGLRENSVHGSDSPRAAINEIIRFMF